MPENLRVEQNETSLIWDGFGLQNLHSGVGYHAWALHQALTQLGRTPSILASTPDVELGFQPWLLGAHWPLFRMKPWSLWVARQGLSSLLRKDSTKNFIFHGLSNYNIPSNKSKRLRKVLTLHDLIPIIAEDQVSLALATYMKWQLPRALRAADAIICVSSWTERELIDRYPFVKGRTHIIPNGRPEPFDLTGKEGIFSQGPKILTIARQEKYKRLHLIPSILALLPPHATWTLVTDESGKQMLAPFSRVDSRLQLRTHIKETELQTMQSSADIYVHPSLLEGFCLPAAASLSCSVPVIFTAASGIDEVVGPGGIALSSNASADDWALAIMQAHGNLDLPVAARKQSQTLPSWSEVAARTLDLYATLGEF